MGKSFLVFFVWLCLLAFGSGLSAQEFPDSGTIYLKANSGEEVQIGSVTFQATSSDAVAFDLQMDFEAFSEHFLSMRPFRCIESDTEWFCYLEYPYSLRNLVTVEDLSDLEYRLLFIRKLPSEFGIDAWNGLYYKLGFDADGLLTGQLMEGDLNVLQSPPAEEYSKPVDLFEFIDAEPDKRLYPFLFIKPN